MELSKNIVPQNIVQVSGWHGNWSVFTHSQGDFGSIITDTLVTDVDKERQELVQNKVLKSKRKQGKQQKE